MIITLDLDEDIYNDYADSVGAYSDNPAVVKTLVEEGLEREIVRQVTRVRTNRKTEAAHAEAQAEEVLLVERIRQKRKGIEAKRT